LGCGGMLVDSSFDDETFQHLAPRRENRFADVLKLVVDVFLNFLECLIGLFPDQNAKSHSGFGLTL